MLAIVLVLSIHSTILAKVSFPPISYDKQELNNGYRIDRLLRDIKSKKLNISLAQNLNKDFKNKDSIFSPYKKWIEDIISLSKIKSIENFQFCKKILDKNNNSLLYKHLNRYCYLKFINTYGNISDQSFKKHEHLFERYLPYYLFPLKSEFVRFLKKVIKKKNFRYMIAKKVLKAYSQKSYPVNTRILPHILITVDLTNYIQKTGLHDKNSRSFAQKRMLALSRKIRAKNYLHALSEGQTKIDVDEFINISRKNSDIINHPFSRRLFVLTGRKFLARDQYSLAKSCFQEALTFSSPTNYDDTLFLYLWPDILNKKYSKVNKTMSDLDIYGKFNDLNLKLKFWIAYTSEMIGKKRLAEHYYDMITESNPVSYYSIMSTKRLKVISKHSQSLSIPKNIMNPAYAWEYIPLNEYSDDLIKSLKRISIFTKLHQIDLISYENHNINNSSIDKLLKNYSLYPRVSNEELREKITLHIASVLAQGKNYLTSFSIIHKGIKKGKHNINTTLLKTLFPTPYIEEIENLAEKDIDPYIILSLIRQESAFNPKARSPVGARGLMQIMPQTAKQISRNISSRALNNPKMNLKLGINYFIKLYNKYDKNLIYTLAAYNAGENRVKRWKKEYFKNYSSLHVIESIPIKETNLYVKFVFRNLFFYKLINGHQDDSEMPHKIFDVTIAKQHRPLGKELPKH